MVGVLLSVVHIFCTFSGVESKKAGETALLLPPSDKRRGEEMAEKTKGFPKGEGGGGGEQEEEEEREEVEEKQNRQLMTI